MKKRVLQFAVSGVTFSCGLLVGLTFPLEGVRPAEHARTAKPKASPPAAHPGKAEGAPLSPQAKRSSRFESARDLLARAANGDAIVQDAFNAACAEVAWQSKEEIHHWYDRFIQLRRFDLARSIFYKMTGSSACTGLDFTALAAPLAAKCDKDSVSLVATIAGKQIQVNPEDIPRWAEQVPMEFRSQVINEILNYADGSAVAVSGCLNLLETLPPSPAKEELFKAFWMGLFDNDCEKTFATALHWEASPLSALVKKWENEDPDGLLAKLQSLPTADLEKVWESLSPDNADLHARLKSSLLRP